MYSIKLAQKLHSEFLYDKHTKKDKMQNTRNPTDLRKESKDHQMVETVPTISELLVVSR